MHCGSGMLYDLADKSGREADKRKWFVAKDLSVDSPCVVTGLEDVYVPYLIVRPALVHWWLVGELKAEAACSSWEHWWVGGNTA